MRRDVFQALADPTRRGIVHLLASGPMNLNSIAEKFAISRPAISKHIKVLNECGILSIRSSGRERYCEVKPGCLNEMNEWLDAYRELLKKTQSATTENQDKTEGKPKVKLKSKTKNHGKRK